MEAWSAIPSNETRSVRIVPLVEAWSAIPSNETGSVRIVHLVECI